MGNETPSASRELPLDDTPVYLLGNIRRVTEKPSAERIIADSVEEYGKTQGENNWFDGCLIDGIGEFQELRQIKTSWGVEWRTDKIKFLELGRDGGHPGKFKGQPVWVVRRWQSPVVGAVRRDGQLRVNDQRSTGVDYVLLVDGQPVDRQTVAKQPLRIDRTIEVRPGRRVDFCVTPGPNNDLNYDAFSFEIRVFANGPSGQ
jgi:hypothetical protein